MSYENVLADFRYINCICEEDRPLIQTFTISQAQSCARLMSESYVKAREFRKHLKTLSEQKILELNLILQNLTAITQLIEKRIVELSN